MRTLMLMRGAPGCGKSTWIERNGLSDYALSSDKIRSMFASPVLNAQGKPVISQQNDKIVWETLFSILERRMQRGDFTVIDACNSKTREMTRYQELAHQYRYRVFCLDMTDIPIDEALRRNAQRSPIKVVPQDYIEKVYSRFRTQSIPSGIKRVTVDDWKQMFVSPFDLSAYDRVVHIGDIHGCYSVLQKAFGENPEDGIDDRTSYIFCGDYADRGPDSPKVLQFLMKISERPNVCFVEGNHEAHLWAWANGKQTVSCEFNFKTAPQLVAAGISAEEVRKFYRRIRQCSYYTYRGRTVLCTHGGLSDFSTLGRLDFVPAHQMIHGVGAYEQMEDCVASYEASNPIAYQVFGHRNVSELPTQVSEHCFCLEGAVERGGELRTLILSDSGWQAVSYPSDVHPAAPKNQEVHSVVSSEKDVIEDLVAQMRQSSLIREKAVGHISSFNFTKTAFIDKRWNSLTLRARGLYIDTENMKIVARGYEKFFAVNERQDTQFSVLQKKLAYPIEVFQKENGFLGLVSYDKSTESLFITTKSSVNGDMAGLLRSMFTNDQKQRMLAFLQEHDVTLLFEAVDPVNDPHIIEYSESHLFLLDMVDNRLTFNAHSYPELVCLAAELGVEVKKNTCILHNWQEFISLYQRSQSCLQHPEPETESIEGYVLRDANGFMLKLKTDYYKEWKLLRGVAQSVYKCGTYRKTGLLQTPLENYFYAFVRKQAAKNSSPVSIIELRNRYYAEAGNERSL